MAPKDVHMSKKKQVRRRHARDFKIAAVKEVLQGERSLADVADSLGINRSVLGHWKAQFLAEGAVAFPGNGKQTPDQEELTRLRRELAQAKQDILILKKAAAFFAKHTS